MKYCHEKFVNFIKDKLSENWASIDPKEIKKLVRRKNKTIFRWNVTYNLLFTCIVWTLSSDEISKEDYVKFFRYLWIEFWE